MCPGLKASRVRGPGLSEGPGPGRSWHLGFQTQGTGESEGAGPGRTELAAPDAHPSAALPSRPAHPGGPVP